MGRPPLGKIAMSGAERQRRYLNKLVNNKVSDVTNVNDKKQIKELEQQLLSVLDENEKLRAELEKLKAQPKKEVPRSPYLKPSRHWKSS